MRLPEWLAAPEGYEASGGRRDGMAKNLLALTALLERVRLGGGAVAEGAASPADRLLARVSAPVRLAGLLCAVLLTCLATRPLFLMLMAAVSLGLVALRPLRGLRATLFPALGATAVAAVLSLPALWIGGPGAQAAMVKISVKTLVNVTLVLGVSWTLGWNRLSSALKALRLPDVFIFTVEMALKHIEVLGRSARELSEAVVLRSVGAPVGRQRTDSAAGVMGATFLKAVRSADAMGEAMLCRGFCGTYPAPPALRLGLADAAYSCLVALMAASFLLF